MQLRNKNPGILVCPLVLQKLVHSYLQKYFAIIPEIQTGWDVTDLYYRQVTVLGHPEYGETPGVETTTGPLGQGVAAATGMAIAQKLLAARFGDELFNAKIWVLAGDGDIMEGISSEAGSLAGTLGLDNLVLIYDSNNISLDGPTSECMLEDTAKRYEAYGFKVMTIDGYNFDQMEEAFSLAREEKDRPILIIAKTIIGKHAPNVQGKNISHGKYLGPEEMKLFKKEIGWPEKPLFYVPEEVREYFKKLQKTFQQYEEEWNSKFEKIISNDPQKAKLWNVFMEKKLPEDFEEQIWNIKLEPDLPTRKYSGVVIEKLGKILPFFIVGSADLSSTDFTALPWSGIVAKKDWNHQQIKFGVREFCMAASAYGMHLNGMIQPVVDTFFVFSDYMRNAIRMAALMKQHVIFVFSHDSILLAQDGPTHQPVEHLMSLRLMPNLVVIRPCDENETKVAWITAFAVQDQPVALCFTRQPVPSTVSSDLTREKALDGVKRGAYVLYGKPSVSVNVEIFATGSEIHPSVGAARLLEKEGISVRVISVPSWELFALQDRDYQKTIKEGEADLKVSVEAGSGLGWQIFVGNDGLIISQETFGVSAPEDVIADYFGFTVEKIYNKIKSRIS